MADDSTEATQTGIAAPSADECTWGMVAHLAALAGFVIPFGSVLGPLVVWLIKKDTMPLVDDQGKEALNFQITMLIGFIICLVLAFVVVGIFLGLLLGLADLVMVIMAAVKAQKGEKYRYPFAIRLIK